MSNTLKELQLQVDALFDVVSENSECFKGIKQYVSQVKDLLKSTEKLEWEMISKRLEKIDSLLDKWRASPNPTPGVLYFEPNEVTAADEILKEIQALFPKARVLPSNTVEKNETINLQSSVQAENRVKKAIEVVKVRLNELDQLGTNPNFGAIGVLQQKLARWKQRTFEVLKNEISKNEAVQFNLKTNYPGFYDDPKQDFLYNLTKCNNFLIPLIEELQTHPDSVFVETDSVNTSAQDSLRGGPSTAGKDSFVSKIKKVFIVHGHDHESKNELEIFLKQIGLEPVVLHRQADEGLTLIEKFEKHGNAGYVIVLATPDDVIVGSGPSVNKIKKEEARARQNVIFEWGYFVGKLGRKSVCCVYKDGTVLPSDLQGLVYKRFTKNIEEVKFSIITDLRAAGYEIDLK